MIDTQKLRQRILDLAIRGKLVPQDPNDEPASVLLEKIRAEKERLIAEGKIKRSKAKKTSDTSHYEDFEPPFEIPESWEWVRLEDIARVSTGATPSKSNKLYYGGHINWVGSAVTSNQYVDAPSDFITELALKETNCEVYPVGTLLMAMYGEGKTRGQITELRIESACNQACAAILPFDINTRDFIKLYLLANYYHLRSLAEGGNQPNLNLGKISSLIIPLPPLSEQIRIIDEYRILLNYVEDIESSKNILSDNVNNMKSQILDLAMQGKLVEQDTADEPAADMLRRINPKAKTITDNPHLQNIPRNWGLCRFGDVAIIGRGGSPRPIKSYVTTRSDGINWIKIGDAEGKFINSTKEKIIPDGVRMSREVHKGDFLLTNSMSFGKPYILNIDGCIHDGWLMISPYEGSYDKDFLYYLLSSQYAYNQFKELAGGAVVSNLNSDKVANTIFPILSIEEQKRIVFKIEQIYSILDEIETSLQS